MQNFEIKWAHRHMGIDLYIETYMYIKRQLQLHDMGLSPTLLY